MAGLVARTPKPDPWGFPDLDAEDYGLILAEWFEETGAPDELVQWFVTATLDAASL